MQDRLNLGIPSSKADVPKNRFEFKEETSRTNSIVIPFFVAAWAALLKQFLTEEKELTKPELKPAPHTNLPGQSSDAVPETADRPIRGGSSAIDVTKMMGSAWIPEVGGLGSSAIEPSNFQFVRTPTPLLRSSPDQGDFGLHLVKPSNDNQLSPSSGGHGGGGGGGGGGGDRSSDGKAGRAVSSPPPGNSGSNNGGTPTLGNRRPTISGPVYLNDGFVNQSITITIGALLTGASDPDGDKLAVQSLTADSGSLEQLGPDRWLFTPARDEAGPVALHYRITDGKETVSQTAYSEFLPRHGDDISGTDGDDILVGTPLNDVIDARGGNDAVYGRESDDAIRGGDGNDRLMGGDGNDVIWGGTGNDVIFGGAGTDSLFGEDGDDILFGEDGNDLLFGGAGDDVLDGGDGADRLDGESGADQLSGEAGNDILDGAAGPDHLDGGTGDDVLLGGTGSDSLSGGDGNDKVLGGDGDDHLDGGAGDDVIDGGSGSDAIDAGSGDDVVMISLTEGSDVVSGGEGNDTVDLRDVVFDSTVNLPDGLVFIDGVDCAQIFGIENIRGGHGRDHLIADDQVNIMVGGEGNDTFTFGTLASLANTGGPRDHVMDFSVGDRLDLSRLGQELDEFAGKKLFFVEPGSTNFDEVGAVTYHHEIISEDQEITVVTGNLDANPEADFEIVIDGHHEFTQADFILDVNAQNNSIQQHG